MGAWKCHCLPSLASNQNHVIPFLLPRFSDSFTKSPSTYHMPVTVLGSREPRTVVFWGGWKLHCPWWDGGWTNSYNRNEAPPSFSHRQEMAVLSMSLPRPWVQGLSWTPVVMDINYVPSAYFSSAVSTEMSSPSPYTWPIGSSSPMSCEQRCWAWHDPCVEAFISQCTIIFFWS